MRASRFGASGLQLIAIAGLDEVEQVALFPAILTCLNVLDAGLRHRNAIGADHRSLVSRGEEGRAKVALTTVGQRRADRDEAGQVFVLRAETIAHPRTDARSHEGLAAGVQFQGRRGVRVVVAVHRVDHAQVIHAGADVGKKIADRQTRLTAGMKVPRRFHDRAEVGVELVAAGIDGVGKFLAVLFRERGLVIERIDVRRAAVHVEEDHPLRTGRKMWLLGRHRIARRHRRKGKPTKAAAGRLEPMTSTEAMGTIGHEIDSNLTAMSAKSAKEIATPSVRTARPSPVLAAAVHLRRSGWARPNRGEIFRWRNGNTTDLAVGQIRGDFGKKLGRAWLERIGINTAALTKPAGAKGEEADAWTTFFLRSTAASLRMRSTA